MSDMLRCISPVDGRIYAERKPADFSAIEKVLGRAHRAQKEWAKVKSDSEAIKLMNDSDFGLSASIWTEDENVAIQIGNEIETGTWFMNRCDYLDPALAWVGVKESGRGCALSQIGFDQLTRPKSFHLKTKLQ